MPNTYYTEKAAFLGKWLWPLFWLFIPGLIAGILTNESMSAWFPSLYLPGQILNLLCSVIYGLILLKISSANDHYRISGICCLVAMAATIIVMWISGNIGDAILSLILTLPSAILTIVSEYHEYKGHEEVLTGVNNEQAEKWYKLWKWYIGTFAATFVGIFAAFIVPLIGLLIILAASIGIIAVSILKLVYLYRSAQIFRKYHLYLS